MAIELDKTYIISDTHFGLHDEQRDINIITKWNSIVSKKRYYYTFRRFI